jgi:hypothetical protein
MLNHRRSLRAAALAAYSLILGSGALLAQETNTVGPAELKDFRLPGERTTPPATAQPVPQAPPPATAQPRAASTTERPTPPRPTTAAPAPQRAPTPAPARTADAPAAPPAPAPAPAPATSAAPPAATATPPGRLQLPIPAPAAPAPAPAAPAAEESGGGWGWLWVAVPAALGLLAFFGLGRRRRPARRVAAERRPRAAAAAPPAPPAPAPAPRARLEIEFVPARAAATDTAATVEFEFVLKNVGDATAGNIRIDTRMFNASARAEIAEFLKGPIHDLSGSPHVTIPPGEELRLTSAIALPKEQVREIELQGRRLFVPVVASNVAWDYGEDGGDRVSLSWLVGRESQDPAAKMGGFRLDLGPRIYRSVGVRPMKLVA